MKKLSILAALLGLLFIQADLPENIAVEGFVSSSEDGSPLVGVTVQIKNTSKGAITDEKGWYRLQDVSPRATLVFSYLGMQTKEVEVKGQKRINVVLESVEAQLDEVVVVGYGTSKAKKALSGAKVRITGRSSKKAKTTSQSSAVMARPPAYTPPAEAKPRIPASMTLEEGDYEEDPGDHSREGYDNIVENDYKEVKENPLSTFSIDVDKASYANVRRFINANRLPPKDAVRIEEMVNYFPYQYEEPTEGHPFNIITEMADCPWNDKHKLLQVALKGKELDTREVPASNLVFLIDVSGSMNSPSKLPLLKKGFELLVDQLRPEDRVAIVVYAGAAGLVLPSTSGASKSLINKALDKLSAGGSTAGAAGIRQAYEVAKENFIKGGNNRVILATDGDFNVGISSDGELVGLIEEKRKEGVFLTVLGFGTGNYQDAKMEKLADKGNGNYAYIDNILEAQKVLVEEMSGTLFAIAKDVKIQIEFNPSKIKSYRLIGYENRILAKEDFNDDTKDAGELGAGHTVTALYEIVPANVEESLAARVDPLKYQSTALTPESKSKEWLTVKFRYKHPEENKSKLIVRTYEGKPGSFARASENLRFASSVAGFGMMLRKSEYKGKLTYDQLLEMAKGAKGEDKEGYRAEFISLVKKASFIDLE